MLLFDGAIAGLGSASGVRLVVGMWLRSPFGAFTDAMVQTADGHRVLVAPTHRIADFVSATYQFDEIRVQPVLLRRNGDRFVVRSKDLDIAFGLGPRGPLGWALAGVPLRWARSRWFATLVDPIVRVLLHGVRTRGTAGGGRREWYCATDLRPLADAAMCWESKGLGPLAAIDPPVGFGFGSVPPRPSWTRLVTRIQTG